MHALGNYIGAQRSMKGDLLITFAIDDDAQLLQELEDSKDKDLVIDADIYREKRSKQANRYLWKLCDLIAKALGSDKDTIYLMKLQEYGVFQDCRITTESYESFKKAYRYVDVLYETEGLRFDDLGNSYIMPMLEVRCYIGSHLYDTKQMSELLNGIVQDAQDIGIQTWSQEEVDSIVDAWRGEV